MMMQKKNHVMRRRRTRTEDEDDKDMELFYFATALDARLCSVKKESYCSTLAHVTCFSDYNKI